MNASTSTLSSIPPPLPPKNYRRISLGFFTSSKRRFTSYSSSHVPSNELPPYSRWSTESDSEKTRKRPTSLFSWRSKRMSCVAIDRVDVDSTKLKDGRGDDKQSYISDRKGRRIRTDLPPLPRLVIEVDTASSYSNISISPIPRTTPHSSLSSPPSLPEFRLSTFQPLDFDSPTSSTSNTRATRAEEYDATTHRPLKRLPPSDNASPTTVPLTRRLEPRSPRIESRPRSVSSLAHTSSSPVSRPRTPVTPPALSSSMSRSTSFTLTLPTVSEVVPNPSPCRHKLRPIVIAPRKPSLSPSCSSSASPSPPSTPRSGSLSSRSASVSSVQTLVDAAESPFQHKREELEETKSLKEQVDWSEVENTLRNLSGERLQILLKEVRRAKA